MYNQSNIRSTSIANNGSSIRKDAPQDKKSFLIKTKNGPQYPAGPTAGSNVISKKSPAAYPTHPGSKILISKNTPTLPNKVNNEPPKLTQTRSIDVNPSTSTVNNNTGPRNTESTQKQYGSTQSNFRQENTRPAPVAQTVNTDDERELTALTLKKKTMEDRAAELAREIEQETQRNNALSEEVRQKADKNNALRSALNEEQKRNQNLHRDLDKLNEKCQKLVDLIREAENQIEAERNAQRNFNLNERTQRIQSNFANLHSSMTQYYNQIMGSLPLLMMLSSTSDNPRLRDMIPILLGTLGEFQNGENVKNINLRSSNIS